VETNLPTNGDNSLTDPNIVHLVDLIFDIIRLPRMGYYHGYV